MKDVFEVVSLDGFLWVEELKELLNELRGHVDLEGLDIDGFVDDKLEEELIDSLDMGPGRIDFLFLFNTCLAET